MNINLLPGISSSSSALAAERTRLQIIAQNIANANVTEGPDGQPYRRQQVVFERVLQGEMGAGPFGATSLVKVGRIQDDPRALRRVYNPGHKNADANGMVALPNVNIHEEMADLIASSRTYEANLAAIRNARNMTQQTLSIGKR